MARVRQRLADALNCVKARPACGHTQSRAWPSVHELGNCPFRAYVATLECARVPWAGDTTKRIWGTPRVFDATFRTSCFCRGKNDTAQPKELRVLALRGRGLPSGSELYVFELPVDAVHLGIGPWPLCFETGRLDAAAKRLNLNLIFLLFFFTYSFDQ